jgi:hypothetical protein
MIPMTPCLPTPGPSDPGRVAIAALWEVAAAVLAAVNIATSMEMSQKQFDLAQRYYRIAREWRDWYNQGFVPLEDKELGEIWDETPHEAYYDAAAGRASVTAKLMFQGKTEEALRCTSSYATGLRQAIVRDMTRLMGETTIYAEGLGIRNERAHKKIMDDIRWKHREAAINRGRGMAAATVTYGHLAAGIYGDLANQAGRAAQGYVRFIGYAEERLKTFESEKKKEDIRPSRKWLIEARKAFQNIYNFDAEEDWAFKGLSGERG